MLDKEEMVAERSFGSPAAMNGRRAASHQDAAVRDPERMPRSVRDSEGSEGGLIGRDELRDKVMGTARLSGESRGPRNDDDDDDEPEERHHGWRQDREPWYAGSPRSL